MLTRPVLRRLATRSSRSSKLLSPPHQSLIPHLSYRERPDTFAERQRYTHDLYDEVTRTFTT